MAILSEALQSVMHRAGVGAQTLSKLTGIPRTAIDNWRDGSARHPRHWRPLLQIARVLTLDITETDALLAAAGYPPLAALARELPAGHPDRIYLQPWPTDQLDKVAAQVSLRHQLRAPTPDFIGRADAIATLLHTLGSAQHEAVAICGVRGMGGIGKTELAYMAARSLVDSFPDAQIVLNLRGTSAVPLPPEQVLQQIIHTFAPDAHLPEELPVLETLYRAHLHAKRVLILADDARDAAQVRSLLPPPGCALLVTSRQRFTLPGMVTLDLEHLPEHEAVAMLCQICPRLSAAEAQTIARPCRMLPLALRVSGSILHNTPALSVAAYQARLLDERQRLAVLRDLDDPQHDVAASLMLSYALLDPLSQQVFRQIGVCVADFTTELAQAVVGSEAGADVEQHLYLLLRRSLVLYDVERARWRLHDLVRDMALHLLDMAGELEELQRRYARAVVQITQAVATQYQVGGDAAMIALVRFDAERLHSDAAWAWSFTHGGAADDDQILLDLAAATKHVGALRYDARRERIPRAERTLAAARRLGNRHAEGHTLNYLGIAHGLLGEFQQAKIYYADSLTIAQMVGDQRMEGVALNNLGNVFLHLGEISCATAYYEQSIMIARAISDRRGEGLALGNLGLAYTYLGNVSSAIASFEQRLAIAYELGDRRGEGLTLLNLGFVYAKLGNAQRAIQHYEQALTIVREFGDQHNEGIALTKLGNAYTDLGEFQRALEYCDRALAISYMIGYRQIEGHALGYSACAQAHQGHLARATALFEQALALLQGVGDRWGEAECNWLFGLALAQHGEREQALPLLRAAVTYEREIGHAKAAEHAALLARL